MTLSKLLSKASSLSSTPTSRAMLMKRLDCSGLSLFWAFLAGRIFEFSILGHRKCDFALALRHNREAIPPPRNSAHPMSKDKSASTISSTPFMFVQSISRDWGTKRLKGIHVQYPSLSQVKHSYPITTRPRKDMSPHTMERTIALVARLSLLGAYINDC